MDNLILHPKTKIQVERFTADPSHALLLTGASGIGKSFVAGAMCSQVLKIESGAVWHHPQIKILAPAKDGDSLPVDAVRELRGFLRLKTSGSEPLRRAVIIEHAGALTAEAQNALLKILEEPPADTLLILTADHPRSLLPTILSRSRQVQLNPPEIDQLLGFFKHFYAPEQVKQAFFLSGGLPGLMHSLLDNQEEHPLMSSVNKAKELLRQTQLQRLAAIESLSKQKGDAAKLVEALLRISRAGLHLAAQKHDNPGLKRWHSLYKLSLLSGDSLSKNANTKLVLTNLVLQM